MLRYLTHPYDIDLELVEVIHELPWRLKITVPGERPALGYRWHCEYARSNRGTYDGVFMEELDALKYLYDRTIDRRTKAEQEFNSYNDEAFTLFDKISELEAKAS